VVPRRGEPLERRARRPLLRVERQRLLEGVERAGDVAKLREPGRPEPSQDLALLAAGCQGGVMGERCRELRPQALPVEKGDGESQDVASGPEARHDAPARRQRRRGILRLLDPYGRGSHQQGSRGRVVRRVCGAQLEGLGQLLRAARRLVERRERLQRQGAHVGVEQSFVSGDGARRVTEARRELGHVPVGVAPFFRIGLEAGDLLQRVAERSRVFLGLEDLRERVRGSQSRVRR